MMNDFARAVGPILSNSTFRSVLAWAFAAAVAGVTFLCAWTSFNGLRHPDGTPKRRAGNNGHVMVDFGGQWLMGRLLVLGQGSHIYHRNYLWHAAQQSYPREDETPYEDQKPEEKGHHEAEDLMSWMMGLDDDAEGQAIGGLATPLAANTPLGTAALLQATVERAPELVREATAPRLGGPLYPPIHAFLMSPLGHLSPPVAYRTMQIVLVGWALLAALGIRVLTQGRIWWPVAISGVMLYPGYVSSLNLGQNSVVVLTLMIWGWVLIARDRQVLAGLVLGLLAFKPVWAQAFFLVPLITGRWRVCLVMVLTGVVQAAATLPVVGWQSWFEWLHVGGIATGYYNVDDNWVFLSRDLLNIPRRWLLDFGQPAEERTSAVATVLGWIILLSVVGGTFVLALRREDRRRVIVGPGAAFLLLGGWLSCFHFMFYDILLTALPIALLLHEPWKLVQPRLIAMVGLGSIAPSPRLQEYYRPHLGFRYSVELLAAILRQRHVYVLNSLTLTLLASLLIADFLFPPLAITVSVAAKYIEGGPIPMPIKFSTSYIGTPWTTFVVLALWAWSGWLWRRSPVMAHRSSTGDSEDSLATPDSSHDPAAQLV